MPGYVKLPAHPVKTGRHDGLPGEEDSFILFVPSILPIPLWRDGARSGQRRVNSLPYVQNGAETNAPSAPP